MKEKKRIIAIDAEKAFDKIHDKNTQQTRNRRNRI